MPAATTRAELLSVAQKEFDKLEAQLAWVEEPAAMAKDAGDTSIKDVVGHRAHWIELFLGWYADGQAGKPVFFPAKGYKWNELKRYNADLRAHQAGLGWKAACALLRTNHRRLVRFIEECPTETLYGGPMKGANNKWTPGRWAEAAGPSHYRSATKYIRARLKAMGD